jgi:SNF2 family DNA or RNA helicase
MPTRTDLHPYQLHGIQHTEENPYSGLFLEMGLGKTVMSLTACDDLLHDSYQVDRVLVIAPLRVAEHTWSTEASKWDHLKHLRISKVLGTAKQRIAALWRKADIYVINRENVTWLVEYLGQGRHWKFDMVVIDELSSFKSPKAARFKALRKVRGRIHRMIGLTGTPAPNSLLDLWPQLYLLDQGQRLGPTVTGYRNQYFQPASTFGMIVTKYKIRKGAAEEIHSKIADICISMKASDYLQLPARINVTHPVVLGQELGEKYAEFEEQQVMMTAGKEITAVNAGALVTKLLQFTGGAIYAEDKTWAWIHDKKLDVLEDLYEATLDEPLLVAYNYQHEAERILARFPGSVQLKGPAEIDAWNRGELKMMIAHPASAGHGLNLQQGGRRVVWYGLPWSLELYQQFIARLDRQGQTMPVMNHLITTRGTIEDDVRDTLIGKAKTQDDLINAVKARIRGLQAQKQTA